MDGWWSPGVFGGEMPRMQLLGLARHLGLDEACAIVPVEWSEPIRERWQERAKGIPSWIEAFDEALFHFGRPPSAHGRNWEAAWAAAVSIQVACAVEMALGRRGCDGLRFMLRLYGLAELGDAVLMARWGERASARRLELEGFASALEGYCGGRPLVWGGTDPAK